MHDTVNGESIGKKKVSILLTTNNRVQFKHLRMITTWFEGRLYGSFFAPFSTNLEKLPERGHAPILDHLFVVRGR